MPGGVELLGGRPRFRDRAHAGELLARHLAKHAADPKLVVIGLARGGVPVARKVADALGAQPEVMVARKVGVPGIEEVALGAIAEGSDHIVSDDVAWFLGVPPRIVERLAARERTELERRVRLFRSGRPLPDMRKRTVVLVDDGLASGATLLAAARALRRSYPGKLVAAVPVAAKANLKRVRAEVDELVVAGVPARFETVSTWYEDFSPVTDDEVLSLLEQPTRRVSESVREISARIDDVRGALDAGLDREWTVDVPVDGGVVSVDLGVPGPNGDAVAVRGLALLAHGGGSSRNSYRNRYIAGRLRLAGYATMRVDLLTRDEQLTDDTDQSLRFDVNAIASRLTAVFDWATRERVPGVIRTVLIGASTGAAAALMTAARRPGLISGVVARAGRVDLAEQSLAHVRAPVLMVVGTADPDTLWKNADAARQLRTRASLVRVRGAGHSFLEPGALGTATEEIVKWMDRRYGRPLSGALTPAR
jgi:putative phosphoribosyl transferase